MAWELGAGDGKVQRASRRRFHPSVQFAMVAADDVLAAGYEGGALLQRLRCQAQVSDDARSRFLDHVRAHTCNVALVASVASPGDTVGERGAAVLADRPVMGRRAGPAGLDSASKYPTGT